MANFHIEGRQKTLPDILRTFLWEVELIEPIIGSIKPLQKLFSDIDGLSFRVKNVSLPSRNIEYIETWFYGLKHNIPSKTSFDNRITLSIEETEDQYVLKTIYKWMEKIQGIDPYNLFVTLGGKIITKSMILKQVKYDGSYVDNFITLKNVFPTNISEVSLDYSGNEAIRYDVTFSFDYWSLSGNNILGKIKNIL